MFSSSMRNCRIFTPYIQVIFLLFVGNCSSGVTSKLENLFPSPDAENSNKCRLCSCGKKLSASQLAQDTSAHVVSGKSIEKCPYVCCFCCKRFTSPTALLDHLKQHNYCTPMRSDKSPASGVVVNRRRCDRNNIKDEGLLSCKSCTGRFSTQAKLQSHVKLAHEKSRHCCPQCGRQCASASKLKTHVRRSHAAASDTRAPASHQSLDSHKCGAAGTAARPDGGGSSLSCNECGAASFGTRRGLMLHRRVRRRGGRLPHTSSCRRGGPRQFVDAAAAARRHASAQQRRRRPHVCAECGRGFRHAADLDVHARCVHAGGGVPLACGVCRRWMSSASALRAHMRIHRPGAPPSVCIVCDKPFSYLSSLRAHMKRQHQHAADSAELVANNASGCWRCVECSAELSTQSLLSDHINSCRAGTSLVFCICLHVFKVNVPLNKQVF